MKYNVYLQCNNGNYGLLILRANSNKDIVQKVKEILFDNEGGYASVGDTSGFFLTTIEV